MSLFVVKNDEGLLMDDLGQFKRDRDVCAFHSKSDAKYWADNKHAHVVELVEKPAPEVVSEAEAKILEGAKKDKHPCMYIAWKVLVDDEDRLMRAYVIGYTVAKEKKYNVKVPLVQTQGGLWFFINSDDKLDATYLQGLAKKFTLEEIEHHGLQDCEKVEVTNDEQ